MKKTILALMIATSLTGCTTPTYTANGVTYRDYGLLNREENYDPKVKYGPNWGNIVVGALLFETIIAPIYVFGFHLMEPVGLKE